MSRASSLHGLELQPAYARLARENAALNGRALTVHEGDLRAMPAALRSRSFDAVMLNPPFHGAGDIGSPDPGRDLANRRGEATLADWIGAALARTRPGGLVVAIMRAEGLPEILAALAGRAAAAVLPLAARARARRQARHRPGAQGRARPVPAGGAAGAARRRGASRSRWRRLYRRRLRAILRDAAALEF